MSDSTDDDGPFSGVVAGNEELREAIAVLRNEVESLQRLEPLFVEGTAVLRLDIQSLRGELRENPAVAGELPGLKSELRTTLREATEHMRTLVVEEVNELRSELQGVRARLTDRRSEDRADLRTSLAAGSDTLRAALAEDSATVRAEIEAVRAQLKEQQVADQQLLRAELRAALREWNEHLRTRIVEEATELRGELHQVRGQLTDQQTQHRSDLKAAMGEGSGQLVNALAEAMAALRAEVGFLRDQLATREMVASALDQQEQVRTAVMGELAQLRADVQLMPVHLDEQRTASQVDTRSAVNEGSQAAEVSFAQHADRLLTEVQGLLAKHAARHGDESQHLRAIVTAGTENLRAALLSETASARDALVEHSERLRAEIQAVWATLNDQHAEERSELGRALGEGTDHLRGSLRREVEAMGSGLFAAQAAAQDELASLRGRVEAFSALFSAGQTAARTDLGMLRDQIEALRTALTEAVASTGQDSGAVRVQLDALGMDVTSAQSATRDEAAALRARLDEVAVAVGAAQAAAREEAAALKARLDEVASTDLEPVRAQLEAIAAQLPVGQEAARDQLRSALSEHADRVRAALVDEAAATRDTIREASEQLRASLLVELTEFIQSQIDGLAQTGAASLVEQVKVLRGAIDDAEHQAHRERLQHDVTVTGERLTGLQLELTAWREQATDERAGEVDALLAAVAGNEERLHQLVTALLAEADRRRAEDREATRAAFTAATEERQAQLAYLEQALQIFNQALALNRQEMQALVTWNFEATDASVGQLGADLAGRLDALGSMLARMLSGEGVLEVSEAVAALRADLARISRKIPAKPKPGATDDPRTAARAPRAAPPARSRRPR